ncbi:MAG: hypothetical protein M3115_01535 [Thermoproteota archaeon]|nr:hypothetical protein [Thermoproteota archaeon]
MGKGLSIYQKAILERIREKGSMNILEVCNLVFDVQGIKKDSSFKPTILSRIHSLEEIDNNTQGMYRMMKSLEKRGLVARLLHRRPTVWYNVSWKNETPNLEPEPRGLYDFNHVMYRDGQVLFQTKGLRWIIKGVKMSRAQIKRQIEQQISDMKKRKQPT